MIRIITISFILISSISLAQSDVLLSDTTMTNTELLSYLRSQFCFKIHDASISEYIINNERKGLYMIHYNERVKKYKYKYIFYVESSKESKLFKPNKGMKVEELREILLDDFKSNKERKRLFEVINDKQDRIDF